MLWRQNVGILKMSIYAEQNVGKHVVQDAFQNQGCFQNIGNQNVQIGVPNIDKECYNCRGLGHLAKELNSQTGEEDASVNFRRPVADCLKGRSRNPTPS
ncbi:retrovirus-related pol polyprotein from transposon TNT 1-94 [Tanacetum coccineum]